MKIMIENRVASIERLRSTDVRKKQHENNMYGKIVISIEACESGLMFENILPNNINAYATTSANSKESSYACYFDDKRNTYLGDSYSVHWMEDSDQEVQTTETPFKSLSLCLKWRRILFATAMCTLKWSRGN
ncbi:legumain [Trichonephila clavipes]|nr:legumain [Trichonephila clavipes]